MILCLSVYFHTTTTTTTITTIVTKYSFYYILYETSCCHHHHFFILLHYIYSWHFITQLYYWPFILPFITTVSPYNYCYSTLLLFTVTVTDTDTVSTITITIITFITTLRLLLLLVCHQPSHLVSQAAATHEGIHGPKPEPSATTPHRSVRPNQAPLCLAFLSVRKQGGAWAQGKCVTLTECTL